MRIAQEPLDDLDRIFDDRVDNPKMRNQMPCGSKLDDLCGRLRVELVNGEDHEGTDGEGI